MIEITRDDVREGLKALVDANGEDFIYQKALVGSVGIKRCVYVYEGKPSCIVGQFLFALGVPLERLEEADWRTFGGGTPADELIGELVEEGRIQVESGVAVALTEAQNTQDWGLKWGIVLRRAEGELNIHEPSSK